MAKGQLRGHPGGQQAIGFPPTSLAKSLGKDLSPCPTQALSPNGSLIIQDQIWRGVGLELPPFVLSSWTLVGLEGQEKGEGIPPGVWG